MYRYSSCDTIEFCTDEQRTGATAAAAVPSSSFVEDEEISWRPRGRARMAIRTLSVVEVGSAKCDENTSAAG